MILNFDKVKAIAKTVIDAVVSFVTGLKDAFVQLATEIKDGIVDAFTFVKNKVKVFLTGSKKKLTGLRTGFGTLDLRSVDFLEAAEAAPLAMPPAPHTSQAVPPGSMRRPGRNCGLAQRDPDYSP